MRLFFVLAFFAFLACGGESNEGDRSWDWGDPTAEPEGWENPYSFDCQLYDPENLDVDGRRQAQVKLDEILVSSRVVCVRPSDGFGGHQRDCDEIHGAEWWKDEHYREEVGETYKYACYSMPDEDGEPIRGLVNCLWTVVGEPVDGVCEYSVVCIPEERWRPDDPQGEGRSWDEEFSQQCPGDEPPP